MIHLISAFFLDGMLLRVLAFWLATLLCTPLVRTRRTPMSRMKCRQLANLDEARALTLAEVALALATASPTANADPDVTPPDEEAEHAAVIVDEDAEVEVEGEEGETVSEEEAEDALEAETDLQPPQHTEALDILASMEVKFAILRERIYIDELEEIATKEAMILSGTHPKLLHFLTTLSQLEERRTNLASQT